MSSKKNKSIWRKWFKTILLRNDTLEEVGTFTFTPLHLLLTSLFAILLIVAITVCIVFYTPIKRLVPGYAEIKENRVYMDLYNRTQDLEQTSQQQALYIEKLRNLMYGEHRGIEDLDNPSTDSAKLKGDIVARVGADDSLRRKLSSGGQSALVLPRVVSSEDTDQSDLRDRTLIAPIKGVISAPYKKGEDHFGIDILAPAETPIKSIDKGVVIAADWTMETGYTIGVQHQDNLISYYKHNSSLLKKTGDIVESGEAIAIIGNTGHLTTGPHLHFELWYNGNSLDPARYINFEL